MHIQYITYMFLSLCPILFSNVAWIRVPICDRACENRACGLKYTMSFDEKYLYTEMVYLDSVTSVVKPNKLSTNLQIFVAVPYWNKKL